MENLEDELRFTAIKFGVLIATREFAAAHALLAPELSADISPGDL